MEDALACGRASMKDAFLYLGYGSNLSRACLHINCPSAELVGTACLQGFRLAFTHSSPVRWRGGVADIVDDDARAHVWGKVWRISNAHSEALDRQEGTHIGAYKRIVVNVQMSGSRNTVACRGCRVVKPNLSGILPSATYKQTILAGAEEAVALPEAYIDALSRIEDNGAHVTQGWLKCVQRCVVS